ncbi:MAG: MFS transporter [Mobilicoccus sp.]|nr:MFS transporter [Mobilicoccus sp.]
MTTAALHRAAVQRRTVRTLTAAQVFSSLGNGSTLALGSVLAYDLTGRESLAGTTTMALGIGTALSAIPLARLALSHGRRVALGTGLGTAIVGTFAMVAAVVWSSYPVLLLGSALVGVATAVNLQARFAVTDLAEPHRRGRELSLVVWAITVGAVLGPNTVAPGAVLAAPFGLPPYAGAFLISAAGMVIGGVIVLVGLRPDPLLTRRHLDGTLPPAHRGSWASGARILRAHPVALGAVVGMVGAHAAMVAVMSMTPLHIEHRSPGPDDHTLTVIGVTISLHIAGMYALSPVVGALTDRLGPRVVTAAGLVTTITSTVVAAVGAAHLGWVTVALVLLGLGWCGATVAGATLLTGAIPPERRVEAQGFADAVVSLVGASGAAVAGLVMGGLDYPGVAIVFGILAALAAVTSWILTRS